MDFQEKVTKNGIAHFHRGNVMCAMTLDLPYGKIYWGHIGVRKTNPYYGSIFVKAFSIRLYKVTMVPTGNSSIDDRYWFGFEGGFTDSNWSFDDTMEKLKWAADFMSDAEDKHIVDEEDNY